MLVLSRKPGESVLIGAGITVEVLEVRGGRVRLGIAADKQTPIHRSPAARPCPVPPPASCDGPADRVA